MKNKARLFLSIVFILSLASNLFAQDPRRGRVLWNDPDGSPSTKPFYLIDVPTGGMTDDGDGSATLTFLSSTTADLTYHRLDAANTPFTNDIGVSDDSPMEIFHDSDDDTALGIHYDTGDPNWAGATWWLGISTDGKSLNVDPDSPFIWIDSVLKRLRFPLGAYTNDDFYIDGTGSLNTFLQLDQTTPQTISNGIPVYEDGHAEFTLGHQIVDKEYVDQAVTAINVNYYMLDTASGVSDYKLTQVSVPSESETTDPHSVTANDQYLRGWISPVGGTPGLLVSGVYNLYLEAEVNATAGTQRVRLYWTLVEYKADTSEVLIGTSENSDELTTTQADYNVHFVLPSDYIPAADSRVIGKLYADLSGVGGNPTATLYYLGAINSYWGVPSSTEVLDGLYLQLAGANADQDIDVGEYSITANEFALGNDEPLTLGPDTIKHDSTRTDIIASNDIIIEDIHPSLWLRSTDDNKAWGLHYHVNELYPLGFFAGTDDGTGVLLDNGGFPIWSVDYSYNLLLPKPNSYLNFGGGGGSGGYGFRDNAGTMQFKNSSGSWTNFGTGSGYTNLTQFVDQTAWRLFYSDASGDVTELAFGDNGEVLTSTGTTSAPDFEAVAEVNNLETVCTGIATTEIPIGTAANTVVYAALSSEATMDNAGAVTLADSVAVTSWNLTTPTITTSLTTDSKTISEAEIGRLDGLAGIIVTDVTSCTDLEGTLLSITGTTLNATEAQDLAAVCAIGASYAGTITVDGLTMGADEPITLGTAVIDYDTSEGDVEITDDVNVKDGDPHIKFVDTTADEDDYEIYADGNQWHFNNYTDEKEFLTLDDEEGLIKFFGKYQFPDDTPEDNELFVYDAALGRLAFETAAASGDMSYSDTRIYFGSHTYDASTTGSEAVTGVGFTPTGLLAWACIDNANGFSVGGWTALEDGAIKDQYVVSAGQYGVSTALSNVLVSSENQANTTGASFDADGFTVTKTKNGTPTGTVTLKYLAYR